ncbi:hypothetical protein X798_05371 [Onchocerca flexuosa]|uniref:Uncharacterized protein n=1 Tax=Onchocerca flexuosa TaxID=387005 RepID=A0A238BQX5_9BILA|nr:hypothetical protein X798_05371 [Onchocerca flexuosa]
MHLGNEVVNQMLPRLQKMESRCETRWNTVPLLMNITYARPIARKMSLNCNPLNQNRREVRFVFATFNLVHNHCDIMAFTLRTVSNDLLRYYKTQRRD